MHLVDNMLRPGFLTLDNKIRLLGLVYHRRKLIGSQLDSSPSNNFTCRLIMLISPPSILIFSFDLIYKTSPPQVTCCTAAANMHTECGKIWS